jgi:hypothetical protein
MVKIKPTVFSMCLFSFMFLLAFSSCATTAPATQAGSGIPDWTRDPYQRFDQQSNIAAVGTGSSRQEAEKNALANLVAIFGQSIQADQAIINTYQEAVKNGVTVGWTDTTSMQNAIKTSASMDTLVGAEIKETWFNSLNTWYAAAVMEKARSAMLYREMITANQNIINNLITMNQAEKNSLEGFSRYQLAATVADVNITYGNVLRVIGAAFPVELVKGDNHRIEAQNITKAIPVVVIVKNDKSGRIQGAFAKAFSDLGFRSGGSNARYVLEVNVVTAEVDLANPNKFARMELSANLTDTSQKVVLLPYNFNNREGHTSYAEAENRVYAAAERKINEEYAKLLSDYLSQLLPERK